MIIGYLMVIFFYFGLPAAIMVKIGLPGLAKFWLWYWSTVYFMAILGGMVFGMSSVVFGVMGGHDWQTYYHTAQSANPFKFISNGMKSIDNIIGMGVWLFGVAPHALIFAFLDASFHIAFFTTFIPTIGAMIWAAIIVLGYFA